MNSAWLSYVPEHVVQDILEHPDQSPIGREQRFEAVALFADVSGFTAISEALGRTGKTGTEELTTILNSYFEPMIALIQSYGGIIGKFGGDAMTVLFPIDDLRLTIDDLEPSADNSSLTNHQTPGTNEYKPNRKSLIVNRKSLIVRRAIQCAVDMQAGMDRYAAIPTPVGTYSLAMKAGLAMGTVLCTSVGKAPTENAPGRLEYLIAGNLLDLCADAEHHATKGEVVIHKDLLPFAGAIEIIEERGDFTCLSRLKRRVSRSRQSSVVSNQSLELATQSSILNPQSSIEIPYLAAYLHPVLIERLREGRSGFINEHRKVTVLFVSFSGFDYDHDPAVSQKLQSYLSAVVETIQEYDGYLNKVDMGDKGSKYIILFGAPVAHEDDEERALQCALKLSVLSPQSSVLSPQSFSMRIGVNTGFVYCGQVGSELRQEYTVMGDAVNLSARMMQAAKPGQILVSGFTQHYIAEKFSWERFEPIQVKGKSEPIPIYGVRGRKEQSGTHLQELDYELPMVGRKAELARVAQQLERIKQGKGQIIGLTAEAGMGKSRLGAEIIKLATQQGFAGFGGECQSYGTNISYLVWHNLWRGFFGVDSTWTPERQLNHLRNELTAIDPNMVQRLPLLDIALNLSIPDNDLTRSLEAKERKAARESLLIDCLRAKSSIANRQSSILLVLEDCHWIDSLSQELVVEVVKALADLPVLLLMLYRPVDTGQPTGAHAAWYAHIEKLRKQDNFEEIRLKEFDEAEAEQLIKLKLAQRFGIELTTDEGKLPTTLFERITGKAQGNPFYIDEILNLMDDQGIDPTDTIALEKMDLPDSLYSLIISRIDQLLENEKITLKVASVIGRLFKASWLWGAYPELGTPEEIKQNLNKLRRLDLTPLDKPEPELEYLFKHVITQEVAYESLAVATREMLHENIGQYIEFKNTEALNRYTIDLLAYHYGRSRNQDKQQTYFLMAGEAAQTDYANETAIDYYRRLLPLLGKFEQIAVKCKLGDVLTWIGKAEEAEAGYREALAIAQNLEAEREQARCEHSLGALLYLKGAYADALEWEEQAKRRYEQLNDRQGISEVVGNIGIIYSQQAKYEQALKCHEQKLQIANALADQVGIQQALGNIGLVYQGQGDYKRAQEYYENKLAIATTIGDRRGVTNAIGSLGLVYRQQGDYLRTLEAYQQALQTALEIGNKYTTNRVIANMGNVYEDCGEYAKALTCHIYLWQSAVQIGDQRLASVALGNMASVCTKLNRYEEAEKLYNLAIARCRALNFLPPLCFYLNENASLLTCLQRYNEAYTLVQEVTSLANQLDSKSDKFKAQFLSVQLHQKLDNFSIEQTISELEKLLDEWKQPEYQAKLHYEIWRMNRNEEQHRENSANLYGELYKRTPKMEYRQRYEELTGQEIPPHFSSLPELPEMVSRNPIPLERILAQIAP